MCLEEMRLQFEALRKRLKQTEAPEERLHILREMAVLVSKMDDILGLKDLS